MKLVQIVGARPQFIKYFPVHKALGKHNSDAGEGIADILVHTGQHYDYKMSEVFFKDLGLKEPDYHLDVGSGSHGGQTALILQRVEEVLLREKPDAVVVYGDTNSTLGGALAAVKIHIPVFHVEAGLRSFNKYMPEEINRVLTDHSSSVLFCPTDAAVENLRKEGFKIIANEGKLLTDNFDFIPFSANVSHPLVFNVGDVMHDVLISAIEIAGNKSDMLKSLDLTGRKYCVLTLHRAENTDDQKILEEIMDFVNEVSAGTDVIFPVHPRTKKAFGKAKKKFADNIRAIDPLGYFDMLWLLRSSALVFTDSGGLQKEACWLKVPCITLRNETEWIETVKSGWNVLFRDFKGKHEPADKDLLLYGDGKTAEMIVSAVVGIIQKEKDGKR